MKDQFIQNELWTLTVGASFQRAHIYKRNASEKDKKQFKIKLRGFIDNLISENYQKVIKEDPVHIENIQDISDFTTNFSSILTLLLLGQK